MFALFSVADDTLFCDRFHESTSILENPDSLHLLDVLEHPEGPEHFQQISNTWKKFDVKFSFNFILF